MTADILMAMGTALFLTILLETLFGALRGIKTARNFLIIILANILTNPIVNVVHSFCSHELRLKAFPMLLITMLLEISAVIAEWLVYKSRTDIQNPFLFSLSANVVSFISGIILNIII